MPRGFPKPPKQGFRTIAKREETPWEEWARGMVRFMQFINPGSFSPQSSKSFMVNQPTLLLVGEQGRPAQITETVPPGQQAGAIAIGTSGLETFMPKRRTTTPTIRPSLEPGIGAPLPPPPLPPPNVSQFPTTIGGGVPIDVGGAAIFQPQTGTTSLFGVPISGQPPAPPGGAGGPQPSGAPAPTGGGAPTVDRFGEINRRLMNLINQGWLPRGLTIETMGLFPLWRWQNDLVNTIVAEVNAEMPEGAFPRPAIPGATFTPASFRIFE